MNKRISRWESQQMFQPGDIVKCTGPLKSGQFVALTIGKEYEIIKTYKVGITHWMIVINDNTGRARKYFQERFEKPEPKNNFKVKINL